MNHESSTLHFARRVSGAAGTPVALFALLAGLFAATPVPAAAMEFAGDERSVPLPAPGTRPPSLKRRVVPVYPIEPRREGIAGTVLVQARVGRDGRVRETRIGQSVPGLDEAAISAVQRFEFAPATRGGLETESWVEIPVRFDDSLPTGARGGEPVATEPNAAAESAFQDLVRSLKGSDPALPGPGDVELRESIMRASLRLDMIPPPGDEAVQAFLLGDSLSRAESSPARERGRQSWILAAHLAPWWAPAYRRLAAAALADRDYDGASACLRAVLAARPGDPVAEAMTRRARQSSLSEGRAAADRRNRDR